jgi:hypothetical protein
MARPLRIEYPGAWYSRRLPGAMAEGRKLVISPGLTPMRKCNAASDWVRFFSVGEGLKALDRDRVFARYWTHPEDLFEEMRHKSEKCAEVLVPDCVMPSFLLGAYVANEVALQKFQQLNIGLPVCIRSDIFF